MGNLLWLDLETFGTNEVNHRIWEIAIIVTDDSPQLVERFEYEAVIQPNEDRIICSWEAVKMAVENGADFQGAKHLYEVQDEISNLLRVDNITHPGPYVLAGSGVSHFDLRFLRRDFPDLMEFCKYYTYDFGVLRRTLKTFFGIKTPKTKKTHRAMADIRDHLEEARWMLNLLSSYSIGQE